MTDLVRRSLDYFLAQPADVEWTDFLTVLGETLEAQMNIGEVRAIFSAIGRGMARRASLSLGTTLESLTAAINAYFQDNGWGFMELHEVADALEISHACAPLRDAFGEAGLHYSPALLEGMYAEWFSAVGAGSNLKLSQIGRVSPPVDEVRFRLAA